MTGKGSARRPTLIPRDMEAARWEILRGKWKPMTLDPPGTPYEVRRFDALPDNEVKLYWRPITRN